ncbi:MAG: hypothetical protein ABN480_13955 [Dickeya sp.]
MMNNLDENLKPEFGTIYTWFAMDKFGRISVMVNNCFGDIPKAVLQMNNTECILDSLNEYMWEESAGYSEYPESKNGKTVLDLYSYIRFEYVKCRNDLVKWVEERSLPEIELSDYNLPSKKGFFVFHGVEGTNEGEDYAVGYEGNTVMGDYFRFLVPTIYASIDDFPEDLQRGIVVSDSIDFTNARVIENKDINKYFTRMYKQ